MSEYFLDTEYYCRCDTFTQTKLYYWFSREVFPLFYADAARVYTFSRKNKVECFSISIVYFEPTYANFYVSRYPKLNDLAGACVVLSDVFDSLRHLQIEVLTPFSAFFTQ